jgi:hypothetical protein
MPKARVKLICLECNQQVPNHSPDCRYASRGPRPQYFFNVYMGKAGRAVVDAWARELGVSSYRLARAMMEYVLVERAEGNHRLSAVVSKTAKAIDEDLGLNPTLALREARVALADGRLQ